MDSNERIAELSKVKQLSDIKPGMLVVVKRVKRVFKVDVNDLELQKVKLLDAIEITPNELLLIVSLNTDYERNHHTFAYAIVLTAKCELCWVHVTHLQVILV